MKHLQGTAKETVNPVYITSWIMCHDMPCNVPVPPSGAWAERRRMTGQAEQQKFYVYIPTCSPNRAPDITIADLIPIGRENAISRQMLVAGKGITVRHVMIYRTCSGIYGRKLNEPYLCSEILW